MTPQLQNDQGRLKSTQMIEGGTTAAAAVWLVSICIRISARMWLPNTCLDVLLYHQNGFSAYS